VRNGRWEQKVEELIKSYEIDSEFDARWWEENSWKKEVEDKVKEKEERRWRIEIESKPKLRTYVRLDVKLGLKRYLDLEDSWVRRRIARLRAGTVQLRVETGRWIGESLEERVCKSVEKLKMNIIYCGM